MVILKEIILYYEFRFEDFISLYMSYRNLYIKNYDHKVNLIG
jgi:hypothetical protein